MADIYSKKRRSEIMAAVKNRNTNPERKVRSALFRAGFRFRLHKKELPGSPDIILPRYRTAVFVHGCFWHGHNCPRGKKPTSNADFWEAKIERNKERDQQVRAELERLGWKVVVIWTCGLGPQTDALIDYLNRTSRLEAATAE